MNKNNHILLGTTISYILIAMIQIRIDGLLPATGYITIAFVSLEFTIFEMLKSAAGFFVHKLKMINIVATSQIEHI